MVQHHITYEPFAPPREVCEQIPDPSDPECNGQCPGCLNIITCAQSQMVIGCDGTCEYIQNCYNVPQYDGRTGYRGNVTQVKRYADAATLDGVTAVVETRTYDIAGNVREQTTSCCEKTTITYTTNTQYAWPESQTSGSPTDTSKQNTSSATYDYWTGLVMTSTDADQRVSQIVYDPNTLRLVYKYSPTGAYEYHLYDDQNLFVADCLYEAGQSGANFASRSDKYLDGHGREVRDVAYGKDYVLDAVDTKFDNLGRVSQQSRPYRYGAETPQWNTATYDSLGRPVQTTSPDGSVVTRAYDQSDPP